MKVKLILNLFKTLSLFYVNEYQSNELIVMHLDCFASLYHSVYIFLVIDQRLNYKQV